MSAPKIIFLDIDGVLTSHRATIGTNQKQANYKTWAQFDPVAVAFLNSLCYKYENVQLVLSSTWRNIFDKRAITFILLGNGLRVPLHNDYKTESFPRGKRRDEIKAWLEEHPDVSNFLILDDDSDANVGKYFVRTCSTDGMLTEHMRRIVEITSEWK